MGRWRADGGVPPIGAILAPDGSEGEHQPVVRTAGVEPALP